jgi:hypothetical protein
MRKPEHAWRACLLTEIWPRVILAAAMNGLMRMVCADKARDRTA